MITASVIKGLICWITRHQTFQKCVFKYKWMVFWLTEGFFKAITNEREGNEIHEPINR